MSDLALAYVDSVLSSVVGRGEETDSMGGTVGDRVSHDPETGVVHYLMKGGVYSDKLVVRGRVSL